MSREEFKRTVTEAKALGYEAGYAAGYTTGVQDANAKQDYQAKRQWQKCPRCYKTFATV